VLCCRLLLAVLPLLRLHGAASQAASAPNFLWITAEDLCPDLGCYGDGYARTPRLDALARQSVRYTHAFATAPVCSPARSTLITGLYATSLGTQRLRSQFPVPAHIRGFAALLRQAGYYTANNVKTDYNLRDEARFIRDCWNDCSTQAHWRARRPGQPFFAVFNFMTTHQSRTSVWPDEQFENEVRAKLAPHERHDPAQAPLPPFYPDTAEARQAWARYHDCITLLDREVGALLDQLAADGLADETIVFFYGDNGMGMPRGKRCLWDTGLRVPLLIRFPDKFRHLAPAPPGTATDRLVSFVDFAPTMLSLAGVPVPTHMQGELFLGKAAGPPRQCVFGARDRVDEAFDLSRSVRDRRYLYIRNFMPHLSWMQPEAYSDASAFRRQMARLAAEGKLNPAQLRYAAPRKPLEELYDTETDPHQVHNLADSPAHRTVLNHMRQTLRAWLLRSRDVGFLTEPQVWDRIGTNRTPYELARDEAEYPLDRLLEAAELVGRPEAVPQQIALLNHVHDGIRYWAAVGLHAAGEAARPATAALRRALHDSCAVVRIEAAAALVELGEPEAALAVLQKELQSARYDVALHAARALQLLGARARPAWPVMRQVLERVRRDEPTVGDPAMFVRFSLETALAQGQ
jgi:arylsulfatase A-like enzyme